MTYIGSRLGQKGLTVQESYAQTARMAEIARPAETVMFADCAMSMDGVRLIEYSFAEPPFTVYHGRPITSFYMSPSIHFRHRGRANIAWADGHISARKMAEFKGLSAYEVDSAKLALGWLEPIDNTPFDLQ
jgi:prepilin-type processing-associated H-X9-DG protein